MMAVFSITKEIHRLANSLGKLSQNQARIVDFGVEKGNSSYLKVEIIPSCGYYEGGKVVFKIYLESTFPAKPPRVWCCTNIYHPNIDVTDTCSDSNVCLNMFESDGWSPGYGIEGCIMGLLFLMHNPNIEDPLSPYFSPFDEEESFADNVKQSLKPGGGEVDGFLFEGNAADPCNGIENNVDEGSPSKEDNDVNKDDESFCLSKEETDHCVNEAEHDVISCIQYLFVPMDEGNFQEVCVKCDSKRTTILCISGTNCKTETEQMTSNQTGKTISCKKEIQNYNTETENRIATVSFTASKSSITFLEQSEQVT